MFPLWVSFWDQYSVTSVWNTGETGDIYEGQQGGDIYLNGRARERAPYIRGIYRFAWRHFQSPKYNLKKKYFQDITRVINDRSSRQERTPTQSVVQAQPDNITRWDGVTVESLFDVLQIKPLTSTKENVWSHTFTVSFKKSSRIWYLI